MEIGRFGSVFFTLSRNAVFRSVGRPCFFNKPLRAPIGKDLTGHYVFRRCRVLVVGLEDSRIELQRRIAAARIHHRIPKEDLDGWLHYITIEELKGMKLATMSRGRQKGAVDDALGRSRRYH